MKSLIEDRQDQDENHYARRAPDVAADREITLGTTMILLIFFALAVQDAAVFGFGFSMGSKHNGASPVLSAAPVSSSTFGNFKPSPANTLGSPGMVKLAVPDESLPAATTPPPMKIASPAAAERATAEADEPTPTPAPIVRVLPSAPTVPAANLPPLAPTVAPGPQTMVVQVAALSRQEDADLVATTLRRRGYLVNIRTDADRLLHVQVGPFATRKDAEAMKARLLADGFNAYIK